MNDYEQKALALDKELAELLGWHRFTSTKAGLYGDNPSLNKVYQPIPRWTQNDGAALRLAVEYEIDIKHYEEGVTTMWAWDNFSEKEYLSKDFPDGYSCVRYAIVQATINKLKAN